jgi:hypothetical protein
MAAYYVRVAEAMEKLAQTAEIMMSNDASNRGEPMTLGNMRHLSVPR